uniref:Two-component response regulator-like PRR95 n=1 Tax=Anthurium amnicola TaxID=1678845 RepID=A0A1D1Z271_9ARAE
MIWCILLMIVSSSIFRYNSKTFPSPLSTSNSFRRTELKVGSSNANRSSNPGFFQSTTSQCNSSALNMNLEDTDSPNFCLSNQEGTDPCSNLGLLPFPVPIAGITYDGLCPDYGSVMRPIFYTESGLPVWSLNSSNQEAARASLSNKSDEEIINSHPHNQNAEKQVYEAEREDDLNAKSLEEKQHISPVTAQSGSSSLCNGSRSHLNSNGCGSVCDGSNGNLKAIYNGSPTNVSRSNIKCANGNGFFTCDGIKPANFQLSTQREAALNKFRLKRKDRCYEKKVRYQSRKRLAEQRPRVKGQFVRQVNLDT